MRPVAGVEDVLLQQGEETRPEPGGAHSSDVTTRDFAVPMVRDQVDETSVVRSVVVHVIARGWLVSFL
jgi:hypothetical protein